MTGLGELNQALIDVRRAYRLLWSYQRRVLDIFRLIADQFEEHAFYLWETPLYERPIARLKDPTLKSAWAMLPMYSMSCFFLPDGADRNHPKSGEWMLEIWHEADSTCEFPDTGPEPDASEFEDLMKSSSEITLLAWKCTSSVDLNWLDGVWSKLDYPEKDELPAEHTDPPFTVIMKTFDLSELGDKGSVHEAVEEFKRLLGSKLGIEDKSQRSEAR